MPEYQERFRKGSFVQIADHDSLGHFRATWKYHHPLSESQIKYANNFACVVDVGFYHGGDVLYWLDAVPGVWHGQCLKPVSDLPSTIDHRPTT
jgi:hypothetical protein